MLPFWQDIGNIRVGIETVIERVLTRLAWRTRHCLRLKISFSRPFIRSRQSTSGQALPLRARPGRSWAFLPVAKADIAVDGASILRPPVRNTSNTRRYWDG